MRASMSRKSCPTIQVFMQKVVAAWRKLYRLARIQQQSFQTHVLSKMH